MTIPTQVQMSSRHSVPDIATGLVSVLHAKGAICVGVIYDPETDEFSLIPSIYSACDNVDASHELTGFATDIMERYAVWVKQQNDKTVELVKKIGQAADDRRSKVQQLRVELRNSNSKTLVEIGEELLRWQKSAATLPRLAMADATTSVEPVTPSSAALAAKPATIDPSTTTAVDKTNTNDPNSQRDKDTRAQQKGRRTQATPVADFASSAHNYSRPDWVMKCADAAPDPFIANKIIAAYHDKTILSESDVPNFIKACLAGETPIGKVPADKGMHTPRDNYIEDALVGAM